MFENANVGGDTMGEILTYLFRLEPNGQPLTVLQLAGLPVEVVDAVVSLLSRLAFDFGLWSDGAMPMLFVCEEAHRYASVDHSVGFAPTRRGLLRIAKEGRKYGVCLGLVTQRPAELDPTIISQCSTLFAMRMVNDRDQALLRSAVTDAAANLVAFVPSLGTREVVGFGEGFPLPTRLSFKSLSADRIPHSETFRADGAPDEFVDSQAFVRQVVERWRGAAGAKLFVKDDHVAEAAAEPRPAVTAPLAASPVAAPAVSASPVSSRIEQIRAQLLRR
jgi:DNA helicase HerA-like ATPase